MLQQVLESAAITVVLTQGTIFRPLRELQWAWCGKKLPRVTQFWHELMHCPLCLGWWIGAFAGWWELRGLEPFAAATVWHVVASGALAGSTALLFRRLTSWLDANT